MTMFFIKFEVRPTEGNSHVELVESASACCWVLAGSAAAAYNTASFYVLRSEWEIVDSTAPIEVVEEHFLNADVGREQFAKAKRQAVAIYYVAVSRDGQTTIGPLSLERSTCFDLNAFVQAQKKLEGKGRCLHFDSGGQCTSFIGAHSLQKRGLLREISQNGHVYVPSTNIGKLRNNQGQIVLERRGIDNVSKFRGFCELHDSTPFKAIDVTPLTPTDEQVALYTYRTLCRELFLKENASVLIDQQIANGQQDLGARMLLDPCRTGTALGLDNLRRHKECFDESLRERSYQDVEYTLFAFKQKPFLAFSAVLYPEFDFLGRRLQNLTDRASHLDLLAVCSASMQHGWGLLFSWHKTSSKTCREFPRSLARVIREGSRAESALFRMVIASCENLAVAPDWWEKLCEAEQRKFCSALSVDVFAPTQPDYLISGLEGISDWMVDGVYERTNA